MNEQSEVREGPLVQENAKFDQGQMQTMVTNLGAGIMSLVMAESTPLPVKQWARGRVAGLLKVIDSTLTGAA